MIQIDHIINNVDGLHARPIAELADIAKKLGTQIFILKGEKITNGRINSRERLYRVFPTC